MASNPAEDLGEAPIGQRVVNEDGHCHLIGPTTVGSNAGGHEREAHSIGADDEKPRRPDGRLDLAHGRRVLGDRLFERKPQAEDAAVEAHAATGCATR